MSTPDIAPSAAPESISQRVLENDPVGRVAMRKASLRLLPLIGIGYCISYMDRSNVSFAALQMNHALGFSASAYGLGAGLFFLSYAACQIPANMLLVRFGARRWLSAILFVWGLLSVGTMFVKTPLEFYVVRLTLGVAEAGFFPGVIFYVSQWFPSAKRSQAISWFYIALPLSFVVSGSLAGMLLGLQGHLGLDGWQWLFMLEGLPAVLMGGALLFCLPNGPATATWLKDDERRWLLRQLENEDKAIGSGHGGSGVMRALREPRVWLLGALLFCLYLGWYGFTLTAPVMIEKVTGLNATPVGLIVALFGILGAISMLLNGWHSDRKRERYFHLLVPVLAMAVCFLAAGLSNRPAIVVPAFALLFAAGCATQPPVWTLPASFLSGKSAAAGIAMVNMIAMCGGFVGPYWMGLAADHLGGFQRGLVALSVLALVASAITLWVRQLSERKVRAMLSSLST